MKYTLFVSCPKGLEYLLAEELETIGLSVDKISPQGVFAKADLSLIYQTVIWSRLANRVHLILFQGRAENEKSLYTLAQQFAWEHVFSVDKTLAIEFHGTSGTLRNTMYSAQVLKDSIVDYFRARQGERPQVDKTNPQILLHAYLKHDEVTVSLDLTGYSLHQRGYRLDAGEAPLKENLAAALLIRAKWPQLAAAGYALYDPFCGSGTLVIEAAMMACRMAPGLLRQDQALCHWLGHDVSLWEETRVAAAGQIQTPSSPYLLQGSDQDSRTIPKAWANAERADVLSWVDFKVAESRAARPQAAQGLVICNPPYGERLSDETPLIPLYQGLGEILHGHFQGWQAAVFTASPLLAKAVGLRAEKQYAFYNGSLECKLYCFTLDEKNQLKTNKIEELSPGAEMFANRLKKNVQHLQKWAKREQINCYRVYDADLPEYAFAIDRYDNYAVLQEYQAPASVPEHKAAQRSLSVIQVTPGILGIPVENLVVKKRSPKKGSEQYEKLAKTNHRLIVQEGPAKFTVNLYDYLDTGLFLDHRLLRQSFGKLQSGARFLNCFCYTATASVHAALAGALTTNVDLSNTYLQWGEENFKLNQLDLRSHRFIQADCVEWLRRCREWFDVIFLDPPSFSNSKRMAGALDIQQDHITLIDSAMRLLLPGGQLYFSTNLRHFVLSPFIHERYQVEDMSAKTIDQDFKRNQRIHQCYRLRLL